MWLPQLLEFLSAFRDKLLKQTNETNNMLDDLVFSTKVRAQAGWLAGQGTGRG